jgi:hypothetical protein
MRSGGRALLQRPKLSAPLHLEGSIKFETDGARSTGTKRAKLTSDRDEWLEHWWIRATHVNSPSPRRSKHSMLIAHSRNREGREGPRSRAWIGKACVRLPGTNVYICVRPVRLLALRILRLLIYHPSCPTLPFYYAAIFLTISNQRAQHHQNATRPRHRQSAQHLQPQHALHCHSQVPFQTNFQGTFCRRPSRICHRSR